ncbi:HD domain-containing protein [Photobacterium piscicola]|uniref:HD domain-containing protein n=1 Tax=Photobacterium piscicola TaxID=1378299 RepID=UPI002E16FF2F|nr:HD domain-containing protein [Photobacterium piscicola]
MEFDKLLTGKILDPIHGIIRLSKLELKFVDHPLFQRLRTIKQNTFLYKVFPSAMHSRFEHSLGVMHLSYKILSNLKLNGYRYKSKYEYAHIFCDIDNLPLINIQELRLAALLHDIGHGPMSHQFDSFMCKKEDLAVHLGNEFNDVFNMIDNNSKIEHEHISIIFIKHIYNNLDEEYKNQINIDNVIKIIENKYKDKKLIISYNNNEFDILPLLTSIISSCPIDADRMDYLLRDSYFSGVKCGVYDYNRLLMSIVPVVENDKVYLAYKESGVDSIVEFINSRSSLFGQVYYHKTNRAFSAMLNNVCEIAKQNKNKQYFDLFDFYEPDNVINDSKISQLEEFYKNNSDDYFLNEQLASFVAESEFYEIGAPILDDIINRSPWSKGYESKLYPENIKINDSVNEIFVSKLKDELLFLISNHIDKYKFAIDIVTDNAFKDIDKTEIKLLCKNLSGGYEIKNFLDCGDKLNKYQSIKYFIRVFVADKNTMNDVLIKKIDKKKSELVKKFFNV